MEFGAVQNLSKINFRLPADHPDTAKILNTAKPVSKPLAYLGGGKWGRKDWINKVYPRGTKDKDFLEHYAKHFNSIELNALFHNVPSIEIIESWAEKVTGDFRFCPKFPRIISHAKQLHDVDVLIRNFAETIVGFGKNLGPCFLQLPPDFSPAKKDLLIHFFHLTKNFPAPVFIEFRQEDWFIKSLETDEVFNAMIKHRIGAVITDTAGRRDCVHQRLTTPHAFIRFVGNSLHPTDFTRIDEWADRINNWIEQGLESVYFFVHNNSDESEIYTPDLASYAVKKFNTHCNFQLKEPLIKKQQLGLEI